MLRNDKYFVDKSGMIPVLWHWHICLQEIQYRVEREEKSGKGYVNFIFYPRRKNLPGIVIELKADNTPEAAIRQIKDKEYCEKLKKVGVKKF